MFQPTKSMPNTEPSAMRSRHDQQGEVSDAVCRMGDAESFSMQYTPEKIRGMTVHDRHQLWKNARKRNDDEARELAKLIEECGLPYTENTALTMDDPITLKIFEIVNSEESKVAMIEATERGLPAIDGIDDRLSEELGVDYGAHNMSTNTAGRLVAERMQRLGYRKLNRKGKLRGGRVAQTGEIFVKK